MNFFCRVAVLIATFLATFTGLAGIASAADVAALTLQQAIAATLEHNPRLAGYSLRQQALAGEGQTAALRPGFTLNSQFEDFGGSNDYRWVNAPEMTLSLSSVVELGDKRAARINVVSARQQQLASTQRVLTLDVLAAVTRQFIAVLAAQEQLALQQQAELLAAQTREQLLAQVAAGLTAEAELLRADAALAQTAIASGRAAQLLRSERIRLSAYWADPEPAFSAVQADMFMLPPAAPLVDLLLQLDSNPDLALLATEVQLRTAELQETETVRNPSLQWNAGIRRLQSTADTAFVVGVSMPLGTAPRAAGAIASALANRASAELLRDNALVQLQAEVRSLYEAWSQAVAEVAALQSSVLPPLTAALAATEAAFEQGRYSYLELNLAQRQLLEAREAVIVAAARAHMLGTAIERLTGAALRADPALVPQLFQENAQ
jgi:cobalt-zinc-cadmium efflux system outer membrane protein